MATARATELWSNGVERDEILRTLRADGFSKCDAIGMSVEVLRLPLGEAKRLVHVSAAWLDARERDERLHDALARDLQP
jgi:hypothetical protein